MRYAVIDKDEHGRDCLSYIVSLLHEAEALRDEAIRDGDQSEIWAINTPRGTFRTRNGIPIGDDGRPEVAAQLAEELRQYRVQS